MSREFADVLATLHRFRTKFPLWNSILFYAKISTIDVVSLYVSVNNNNFNFQRDRFRFQVPGGNLIFVPKTFLLLLTKDLR